MHRLVEVVENALASTEENADRVIATVAAFYEFVSSTSGEFRFIFESDLTGDGAVQQRLAQVNSEISNAIAEVIAEDTSLPRQQAKLLAVCLTFALLGPRLVARSVDYTRRTIGGIAEVVR